MTAGERRNLKSGLSFCALWFVGLGLFTGYPVLASLYFSFCEYSVLKPPIWTGLENYHRLFGDELFWLSLRNTFFYAAFALPLSMAVSIGLAILLNTGVRGMPFFRTIFYLPSLVPVVASSMLWLWIFNGSFGLLNLALRPVLSGIHAALSFCLDPLLSFLGCPHAWLTNPAWTSPPAWMQEPAWAKPALIIMGLWGVGNSMVIYLAGLQDVPQELYESAEIDGAGWWSRIWHITLPMISPVIYFNLVMGIIGTLQIFAQVFIMTGSADGNPARSTLFYAMYLFSTAFYDLDMGYASAMAWILFLITVLLTLLATKLTSKRVHYAG